jgi:hypothetical protein
MQNDRPTPPDVPGLPRAAPGAPEAPPIWPVPGPSTGDQHSRPALPVAIGCLGATVLGGCVVLLFGVGLLLGHAGVFPLNRPPAHSAPGGPVPSPTSSLTTTPVAGWLQVTPTSVQVGCGEGDGGGDQSQVVVLANRGPQPVQWQASLSVPTEQAGVEVSPHEGTLASGASTAIQLQFHRHDQGAGQQQGVMRFVPGSPEAGPSPSLRYTTLGCT